MSNRQPRQAKVTSSVCVRRKEGVRSAFFERIGLQVIKKGELDVA